MYYLAVQNVIEYVWWRRFWQAVIGDILPVVFEFPSALFPNLLSKPCCNVIKRELKFYFHPAVEMILRQHRRKRSLLLVLIGRRDAELSDDWRRRLGVPKFATSGRIALS